MKIGVVSDTHGCLDNWHKIFSKYFFDADLIIHAGDVLYHGPRNAIPSEYNPKELAEVLNKMNIPMLIACGNCDAEVDTMVLNIPLQSPYINAYINGLTIIATHGHHLNNLSRLLQAKSLNANIFITGHTHIPELYEEENIIFLNPGSPGMSKTENKHGTIALITDTSVDIIDIVTEEKIFSKSISLKGNN